VLAGGRKFLIQVAPEITEIPLGRGGEGSKQGRKRGRKRGRKGIAGKRKRRKPSSACPALQNLSSATVSY